MLEMPSQVCAETSIPKPAAPEFSVKLMDSSYDIPATSSTDPYTGQQVTHPAAHIESRTIQVSIKNQPFTPCEITENGNNWTINLLYNIRFKGHFSEDWSELFLVSDGYPIQELESEYTVLSFVGEYSSTEGMEFRATNLPPGAQVDFQVEAMIGYVHRDASTYGSSYVFTGERSGWSNTQTITIDTATPNTSPSPTTTQNITPTPSQAGPQTAVLFGLDWLQLTVVALVVIAVLLGFVVVFLRRRSVK
jgi:hypothetical protein